MGQNAGYCILSEGYQLQGFCISYDQEDIYPPLQLVSTHALTLSFRKKKNLKSY
jgi:hypothetical protein